MENIGQKNHDMVPSFEGNATELLLKRVNNPTIKNRSSNSYIESMRLTSKELTVKEINPYLIRSHVKT